MIAEEILILQLTNERRSPDGVPPWVINNLRNFTLLPVAGKPCGEKSSKIFSRLIFLLQNRNKELLTQQSKIPGSLKYVNYSYIFSILVSGEYR
jgi:hypothetical protein